jgi:DNA polymerase
MVHDEYAALVARRKACRACVGLTNPSALDAGVFDSDQIGPWSRWQGSLSAELMIVGQDWGDTRYFRKYQGWDYERNPTNLTLISLLESVGITIAAPPSGADHPSVFLTNAVLCLKEDGLQGPVTPQWFANCSSFLRRQVEIVGPKVLVSLGNKALQSVRGAFGLPPKTLAAAVRDLDGDVLPLGSAGNTRLFAVYHCGRRVLNTHRPLKSQLADWARVRRALRDVDEKEQKNARNL